jgi:hypothetical protein
MFKLSTCIFNDIPALPTVSIERSIVFNNIRGLIVHFSKSLISFSAASKTLCLNHPGEHVLLFRSRASGEDKQEAAVPRKRRGIQNS